MRRFLPLGDRGHAHLWCPAPATPAARERRRIQCELGIPSFGSRCRVTGAWLSPATSLARSRPPSAATDDKHARTRQRSPTSAIDAKPEHTGEAIVTRRRAAFHGTALRLAAPRRRLRTDHSARESAPCKARKPALDSETDIPVTSPGLDTLEVTRDSGASLGPPRTRRANGRALGIEPGCLSLHEIRPFLFDPDWPHPAGLRPPSTRLFSPENRRRSLKDQHVFHRRQAAGTTRQQRAAQSTCSAHTASAKRSFASSACIAEREFSWQLGSATFFGFNPYFRPYLYPYVTRICQSDGLW
jgi:hypothetical protein